jgi:archaellum component FlaC
MDKKTPKQGRIDHSTSAAKKAAHTAVTTPGDVHGQNPNEVDARIQQIEKRVAGVEEKVNRMEAKFTGMEEEMKGMNAMIA